MSTAEWNVLGLIAALIGMLLLFRFGMPKAGQHQALCGWLGVVLLVTGTLCQIWANVRWVG